MVPNESNIKTDKAGPFTYLALLCRSPNPNKCAGESFFCREEPVCASFRSFSRRSALSSSKCTFLFASIYSIIYRRLYEAPQGATVCSDASIVDHGDLRYDFFGSAGSILFIPLSIISFAGSVIFLCFSCFASSSYFRRYLTRLRSSRSSRYSATSRKRL